MSSVFGTRLIEYGDMDLLSRSIPEDFLLTEPPFNTPENRELMAEMMLPGAPASGSRIGIRFGDRSFEPLPPRGQHLGNGRACDLKMPASFGKMGFRPLCRIPTASLQIFVKCSFRSVFFESTWIPVDSAGLVFVPHPDACRLNADPRFETFNVLAPAAKQTDRNEAPG